MAGVYERKRKMVDGTVKVHLDRYRASGDDLILGDGKFVGPGRIAGRRRTDSHGVRQCRNPRNHTRHTWMTHVEALDVQRRPKHLIVLGGGYVRLELGQAMRRLGSRITLIARGSRLALQEDPDVAQAILQLFRDEGIDVLLLTEVLSVKGLSGERITLQLESEGHANDRRDGYSRCAGAHAKHTGDRTR